MAQEVTIVEKLGANRDGEPRNYTVASSAVIPKGTIVKIADARTVSTAVAANDLFAGVTAMDKIADYSTTISVLTNFIGDFVASLIVTAGDRVVVGVGPNCVTSMQANTASKAIIVGNALDTVASGSRVNIRVNI